MQLFNWNLTAGTQAKWFGAGRYLRLVEAVGSVSIEVEYEAPETDRISSTLIKGIGVDLSHPVSKERIKSIGFTAATTQILTVLVSEFPTTDSRLSGSVSVAPAGAMVAGVYTALANTATANIAANASRRALTIGVKSSATGSLNAGPAGGADATHGVEIQPGMTYRFETTAAIDIYNGSGATQTYYTIEES